MVLAHRQLAVNTLGVNVAKKNLSGLFAHVACVVGHWATLR